MNNHIGRLATILSQIKIIFRIISKSHPAPCSHNGQEELQDIKTWTNWQSSFVANIDGKSWKSMEISDLTEPTAISKSCQTPQWTAEHSTSKFLRRGIWNFYLSFRIGEVVFHKNPTCGVEAELGIQIPTEATLGLDNLGKIELHNGPHYSPKSSANIAYESNTCSILFILWLSRWAQTECCRSEKNNIPSLTSHVMNNQIRRLSTILIQIKFIFRNRKNILVPAHVGDRNNYKTSRLEPIGNQALSQTLMANDGNLFNSFRFSDPRVDPREPTAIPNRAKDPRGTPEHGTSTLRRRIWNLNLSASVGEALLDTNPTCGVETELGIQIFSETVLNGTYWENRTAQQATLHS